MKTSEDFFPVTSTEEMLVAMLRQLELLNLQMAEMAEARGGDGKVAASANPPRKRGKPRKVVREYG